MTRNTSGRAGLLRFFREALDALKPGGRFVFEPQPWRSYSKRKRESAEMAAMINALELRPDDFADKLREVGFVSVDHLGTPDDEHIPKGFRRPIYVARKAGPARPVSPVAG